MIERLPLDDPRWSELSTFFEDGPTLAAGLSEWNRAIGFDQEYDIYSQYVFNLILHQGTITNAAFAVAPYLADVCLNRRTDNLVEYLADIGWIEANRLTYGLYYNRSGTAEYPEWLMPPYHAAVAACVDLVDEVCDECTDTERMEILLQMKPAFHGNGQKCWPQR